MADGYETGPNGQLKPKKTTVGWEICVEFVDGSSDWIPLKDIKDSNPIELAEYAVANRIDQEPAFKWWASHALRKRNRVINNVKPKYRKTTHKFKVRVPKNMKEAIQLDEANGNTLWQDSIKKETSKASVAYKAEEGYTPSRSEPTKLQVLLVCLTPRRDYHPLAVTDIA